MSITFPNMRAFQDYFIHQESLVIPPEHHLRIQEMQGVSHICKGSLEVAEPIYGDAAVSLMFQLTKFITPLGKVISLKLPAQEVTYDIKDDLEAVFPRGVVITAQKAVKIYARASEFFQLMVISSRMTFTLDADQELYFIGLKEEACKGDNQVENWERLLAADPLSGFERRTLLKKVVCNGGTIPIMNTVQNSLCIRGNDAERVVEFSFSEDSDYSYHEGYFIDRMLLQSRIKVPPGQVLKIHGEALRHAGVLLKNEFSEASPCSFALGQLFLPFGKNVAISQSRFNYMDDTIEIFSDTGFTLELIDKGQRFIDLRLLGRRMIENRCTHITIPANQQAFFYGITPAEREEILGWCASCDAQKVKDGFIAFILSRLPPGFSWNLCYTDNLYTALLKDPAKNWLCISSTNKIVLSLVRPENASIFALSIVQSDGEALARDLVAYEVPAIMSFLFKSIFYFCCDSFRYFHNKSIPNYFKDETCLEIENTIKDAIFNQHFDRVVQDKALLERLHSFMRATPEEFDQMPQDQDESITYILNKIKAIASLELQGSDYLKLALPQAVKYLESVAE